MKALFVSASLLIHESPVRLGFAADP